MSVLYQPSPWQQRFHACDVDEMLGAGAAGVGKTECMIADPIPQVQIEHARCMRDPSLVASPGTKLWRLIEDNPLNWGDSKGWAILLRRTSPRLMSITARMHKIMPLLDAESHYSVQDMTWHFKSGFRYQLGHCVNRDDYLQYFGPEFTWIGFDELVEFEEEQYDQICTRLRTPDPVLKHFLKIRSTSNPVMRRTKVENIVVTDPMWVRKRFVDPAPQGNVRLVRKLVVDGKPVEVTRMFLPGTIDDNPDKEFVRQYKITLSGAKTHIRRALLDGDWYSVAGGYFDDVWDAKMQVCRPFKIPDDWDQFRAMDWGFKHAGCVLWFAFDPDGNLYIHKELNFQLKTALDVALEIREIEKGMGLWNSKKRMSRITGVADTQLWEERGDEGLKKASEMAAVGVRWGQANKKSRARNGMRVYERLKNTEQGSHEGGLYIFETCTKLLRTLPAVQTDPADPQGETPGKANDDDAFDTCMYGVEYASRHENPPMSPADEDAAEDWPDDDDKDKEPDLGLDGYGGTT